MINNLSELDEDLQNEIRFKYSRNKHIDDLIKEYNLERNIILAILNELSKRSDCSSATIWEDKFIVIADTHFGSEIEKVKYLEYVYEFASKYGFKSIIHAGDLMQSTVSPVKKIYQNEEKQLEYITKIYPYDESINNYILFGNHDYRTLSKKDEYMEILKSRADFKFLGFKNAYFDWNGCLFKVIHPIDEYKINIPNRETLVNFYGHRHAMSVKNNQSITVPSLSMDTKIIPKAISFPGFLVVFKNEEDEIVVHHYIFREMLYQINNRLEILSLRDKEKKAENLGTVLTKKLTNNIK